MEANGSQVPDPGPEGRDHALGFLRRSSGNPGAVVAPAVLDDVFRAIALQQPVPGRSGAWIDGLILGLREGGGPRPPLRLCLSHDVDYTTSLDQGIKFFRRLSRAVFADGRRGRALVTAAGSLVRLATEWPRRERYGDFYDWLALEERFGFRSTFFFLPYPEEAPHVCDGDYRFTDRVTFDRRSITVAEMMREIADAGWEVGLHGTFNSARREGLLARQKEAVQAITGREAVSIRQHYLHHVPGLTHRLQARAGFRVDGTMGYNRDVGLRLGTSHPHALWDAEARRALPLVEVPLTAMDTSLVAMGLHTMGVAPAVDKLQVLGEAIEASGGVLSVNWHPHYLPVPTLNQIYVELLTWAKARGAQALCMGALADQG